MFQFLSPPIKALGRMIKQADPKGGEPKRSAWK